MQRKEKITERITASLPLSIYKAFKIKCINIGKNPREKLRNLVEKFLEEK